MNHIYRLLWNSTLGTWIAVSELAKSSGKKSSTKISASVCALIVSGTVVFTTNSNAYSVASADPCANLSDTRVGIGLNAKACTNDAIALGQNAQAVNGASIAIGRDAYAESTIIDGAAIPSVAVGYKSTAIGQHANAFGSNATASTNFSTAIGNFANASSRNALAVGNAASATAVASSAIGNAALATGQNSVALGGGGVPGSFQGAQAVADGATAIGGNSTKGTVASGINSTAISGESVASGINAIAIGDKSKASADNTIVIGASANTSSAATNAVVMGNNANAIGRNNISFGTGAETGNVASLVADGTPLNGGSQIAIGTNAKTDTAGSIAIGYNAITGVSQNFGIAVGGYAQALGNSAIAMGRRAQSTGVNSTAIGGRQAQATAGGATAIGSHTTASGFESLAVGAGRGNDVSTTSTVASGRQSVAMGASSKATSTSAIAVGTESIAAGENGIAIGSGAQANAKDTISIGTGNIVTGQGSGAIGDPTTITGTGTYSIGNNNGTIDAHESGVFGNDNTINGELVGVRVVGNTNIVSNDNAMVVGNENTASSLNAAVLGNYNTVSGEGGVAIGRDNTVFGTRAVSIGTNSEATAEQTISIGHLTKATGLGATALGWSATASNTQSTALGVGANSSGQNASALGAFSTASGSGSIAAGNSSLASGGLSTAMGSLSRATGTLSVALGAALADKNNSVALGALSDTNTNATKQASATLNGLTYGDFAGQVTDVGMQVSIGAVGRERQIKNVGSGEISALSTDAINGSQLHATNSVLGNLGNSIETTLGGNATLNPNGSIAMTNIGNTGQNTVHDAILASQEEVAAGSNVANVTSTTGANGQTVYTVNADGASVSAGSSAVNVVAGAKDVNNITDYAIDLSQDTKDSLVKADTALQSVVTQIDGVDVKTVDQNDNKVNFVSGDNVELTANADGSINVGIAADVNFNTVNTTDLTVTGTTQLGNSFTVNNGGSYYTGPITDGNHITNKTYVDQTAAASKTEVAGGTNVANVTSTTGANGQTVYTVNADGASVSAGSSAVNVVAGAKDVNNITDYAIDLSQDTKDSLVKADTALQSVVTQIDGVDVKTVDQNDNKVNFVSGDNVELTANADGSINVGTAADVNFNTVNTTDLTVTGTTQLGNSFTVNNGGSYYTGPITDGNHITNKTYVDQTAAASKTEVAGGTNVANVTSTTGANGQTVYTVNADGASVSAGSSAVNVVAGAKDVNNITDYAIDLSQDTKDSLVKADTALQSVVTQIDGVDVKTVDQNDNKVNFVSGDNVELTANADGSINVGTAADVNFNTVNTTDLTVTGTTQLGNSFTVNNGGSYYTGPITDGNHITNKTYVDQTAAASKTEVAGGTNVANVTSTTGANGQTVYTVNADGASVSAGSSAVNVVAGAKDVNNITDYAIDLSQDTKDSLVKADTALQSVVTQIDGVDVKTVDQNDNKVNFVSGDNVELTANADGSINVGIAADVNFNTVNTTDLTVTGTTQLGNSFTVNNGGSYYTGPITDGNHITNKTYVDQTAAASKTEVAGGTNVANVTSTTGANGQTVYTVNADGASVSAGSSAVNVVAGAKDVNNITDYAIDLSQDTKDSLVKADTALQSVVTQIDGVDVKTVDQNDNKVNFVSGDNVELTANADGSINVGTAADVNFNTVNTTDLTVTGTTQLGNSFTVNNGGSYYTGPITDGNHITNKTYVDQTAAASKTEVAGGTNVANVTSTTGANGQTVYTVNADGASVSAGSSAVNVVAGAKDVNNITDYAIDLSQDTKDSLVKADTALQSVVTQIDGVDVKTVDQNDNKVNFVSGDNVELTANADGSINVGTAADVNFNTVNTTDLTVTGTTQLGNSFTVNNGGSYYTGPITDGNHITNKTYVDQTAAASKTGVEEGKNIKVTSTTGADGQIVYTVATADDVDFDKVTVGDTTISTDGVVISNGPSITKDGISAGGKKVTDVSDGMISADSKDAINGSQLHAIGNNVTQLFGGNATYVNNQITWNNIGGTGQNTVDDAIKHVNNQVINANQGWNVSTDSGSNATSTVKPGQTVNINGNSDNGVLVTNSGNDIKVSLSDQIKIGSGDNAVSIDGNAGTIQAGNVLIDGSKGNISAGKVNVNGEAGTVNGLTNTTWNPNNIVSGQAATEDQLLQVAQNATAVATAAKTTVTAGENITVSSSKNSDGSTNYQVATNKNVKFDTVTSGSITTDKISVGNVTIDQSGINAGGSKVTNVANGTVSSTSKDAINGSQLHASNTNIYNYLGGGANYETNTGPTYNVGGGSYNNVGDALNSLDQKVTNVTNQLEEAFYTTNKRIDDVENRANAGNAQALATAGLPQAYIPGKSMMAISGGTYRGETGYAIGMSSISDNGKWVFKVSGSGNSRGDFGGTVGAGIQW
ncbi:YadA-like family protein [Acinetobacter pittii]|uniref:YadA-like family protein n=6 Tax=Acinetobacter pittii TaxID=48296 RepID=UPI0034DB0F43